MGCTQVFVKVNVLIWTEKNDRILSVTKINNLNLVSV